jgi:hypothetical protein
MCEHEIIRFVQIMEHEAWLTHKEDSDRLWTRSMRGGCAGHMEGDLNAAQARDATMKKAARAAAREQAAEAYLPELDSDIEELVALPYLPSAKLTAIARKHNLRITDLRRRVQQIEARRCWLNNPSWRRSRNDNPMIWSRGWTAVVFRKPEGFGVVLFRDELELKIYSPHTYPTENNARPPHSMELPGPAANTPMNDPNPPMQHDGPPYDYFAPI